MKQCAWCGKSFTPKIRSTAQKFCCKKCTDAAQWAKRKAGMTAPRDKVFVAGEYFDWREYPNTVII